jgi:uncharacterized coiled-coil DUF342 family protein
MADWSTYVLAALTGGGGASLVPAVKALPEWRRHRKEEREAAEAEEQAQPLRAEAQAQVLGATDQALIIHQRSINTLKAEVEDLQLRHSLQQKESDEQIRLLTDENRQLNEEMTRLNKHIAQLYQTMGQMAEELRGYRAASGQ